MPSGKNTLPKFGDWDNNEDLSYSIIFDKARAEKEILMHTFQEDQKDTPLYQNMLKIPESTVGKRTSLASHDKSLLGMKTRDPGDNSLKLPSGHAFLTGSQILGEQENSNNLQVDPWNTPDGGPPYSSLMPSLGPWNMPDGGPDYSSSMPSLGPLRQPMPMGATKKAEGRESHVHTSGYHVDPIHEVYHGGLHRKPAISPGPGRQMYQGNPAAENTMRSRRNSESSKTADMPEKTVVPRFGDWDASNASSGEGFTLIFNKARDEKKSKSTLKTTGKTVSPLRPDEDLYKNSQAASTWYKKQRGWINALCCLAPPHTADVQIKIAVRGH